MSGRRPETIHHERKRRTVNEALRKYVLDVRKRQREERKAARQQEQTR